MPRAVAKKAIRAIGKPGVRKSAALTAGVAPGLEREPKKGRFLTVRTARFEAVMKAAESSGFLGGKSGRISGRISPALIEQAKKRTGIETDTDLVEFALANVALEDNFAEVFKRSRGKVDPDLNLGF